METAMDVTPRGRDRDRLGEPEEHGFNFDGIAQAEGVLEVMPEGFGYLRSADYNYLNSPDDVYVSNRQIKAAGLQTGDNVVCTIRPPRKGDKYYPMVEVSRSTAVIPLGSATACLSNT